MNFTFLQTIEWLFLVCWHPNPFCVILSGIQLSPGVMIHMAIFFPCLEGMFLPVCLFSTLSATASFVLLSQKTTDSNSSGRRNPDPFRLCSPSGSSHIHKKQTSKRKNKTWRQTPFLFHATRTRFLRGHSWWRREERRLSDATAVIGFLNATPRTMRLLSRPAIGNLCTSAAAWKHPAHVHTGCICRKKRETAAKQAGDVCFITTM